MEDAARTTALIRRNRSLLARAERARAEAWETIATAHHALRLLKESAADWKRQVASLTNRKVE